MHHSLRYAQPNSPNARKVLLSGFVDGPQSPLIVSPLTTQRFESGNTPLVNGSPEQNYCITLVFGESYRNQRLLAGRLKSYTWRLNTYLVTHLLSCSTRYTRKSGLIGDYRMQDDLPKVGHSLFSTDMVPKSQRFEIWHDSISVLFDVAPIEDQPDPSFSAEVESFMVGSMMLARTRSKVQHFSRSNRTIARDGMEHIMLQQYTRGGNDIMTSDKVVRTHAGDIQIIDMGQPTETRTHAENHSAARAVGDEFSNLTVIVARNRLEDMIPNLAALHLQVVRSGTPLNMILSSYIHSLFLQARTLNQVEAEKLTAPTVELIAAAFSDRSDTREVCQTAVDDAVLLSVRRFIDANLHDPDMNPAVIAAALGISRASLFRICEPLGGVMAFVRDRRLHLARRQLLATPTKPLKLLAFEIGFSSPSAFARAFKEQFGFSPSEARDIRTTARDRSVPKHGFAIDRTYEYWMSNLVR